MSNVLVRIPWLIGPFGQRHVYSLPVSKFFDSFLCTGLAHRFELFLGRILACIDNPFLNIKSPEMARQFAGEESPPLGTMAEEWAGLAKPRRRRPKPSPEPIRRHRC